MCRAQSQWLVSAVCTLCGVYWLGAGHSGVEWGTAMPWSLTGLGARGNIAPGRHVWITVTGKCHSRKYVTRQNQKQAIRPGIYHEKQLDFELRLPSPLFPTHSTPLPCPDLRNVSVPPLCCPASVFSLLWFCFVACFALGWLLFCVPGFGVPVCFLPPPPVFLPLFCLRVVCSPACFLPLLLFSPFFFPLLVVAGCPCSLPSPPPACVWVDSRTNFIDVDRSPDMVRAGSLDSSQSAIAGTLMMYDDFREKNASTAHFSTNSSRMHFEQLQSAMIVECLSQVDLESVSDEVIKRCQFALRGFCVCVYRLNRRKTSYTLYIYMRGITGVPGGSVINEDTSPGPVQTYPRDYGDAPGRNCKTQLVVTIVPYIYIFHPYLSN